MTILHILDHSRPIISGYSTRSQNIVGFQRDLGLCPVVLTSPKHGASSRSEMLDGVPHHRTPASSGWSAPYAGEMRLMLRLARRIAQVARAEGADVLHAHSPVLCGLPALWVGRRLGIPVVYEARAFWEDAAVDHGTTREGSLRYRLSRALETYLFKRVDAVITIAESMRREIAQRGVDDRRLVVVPNGVDTERFRPTPRDTRLTSRLQLAGGCVLGFIGSFYHYEGLCFLLEAFATLRRAAPDIRLLLVGGGEEEATLRAAAVALGDSVVFTGQVPHDQVKNFYSVIDVFVYPRLRMRLTQLVTPLKPLEAMAMGRAVLASDVGGLAELITHEVTGLLFRAESQEAFVAEAMRLTLALDFRSALGERARAAVCRGRTWRKVVSRYLPVYQSLVMRGA